MPHTGIAQPSRPPAELAFDIAERSEPTDNHRSTASADPNGIAEPTDKGRRRTRLADAMIAPSRSETAGE
jgi:hypothetical protein